MRTCFVYSCVMKNTEDELKTVEEEEELGKDDDSEKDEDEDDETKGNCRRRDGERTIGRLVRQDRVQIAPDGWPATPSDAANSSGRRASYEHQRPTRVHELRRCRSEVSATSRAPSPGVAAPMCNQNNPLASKDKIQANILVTIYSHLRFRFNESMISSVRFYDGRALIEFETPFHQSS